MKEGELMGMTEYGYDYDPRFELDAITSQVRVMRERAYRLMNLWEQKYPKPALLPLRTTLSRRKTWSDKRREFTFLASEMMWRVAAQSKDTHPRADDRRNPYTLYGMQPPEDYLDILMELVTSSTTSAEDNVSREKILLGALMGFREGKELTNIPLLTLLSLTGLNDVDISLCEQIITSKVNK